MLVEPILDRLRPVKGTGRGRPRRRPAKLHAHKAYDNRRVRLYLRNRGIAARIARIGIDSSERLGRHRWVVGRTVGWLLTFRRLALRYGRSEATITARATLAAAIICIRQLTPDNNRIHC
jgi:transposase